MDLVEATGGFTVGFEEGVRVVRVAEDIGCGAIAGNELIFPMVKVFRKLMVEHEEKAGQGLGVQFPALAVKSRPPFFMEICLSQWHCYRQPHQKGN